MSLSVTTKMGEESEYLDANRSVSPAINLRLQLSCKDSSVSTLPDEFKPRPKLSRTPPNTISNMKIKIDTAKHICEQVSEDVRTDDTYQSSKFHSPSLSIEYPPGSSSNLIAMLSKTKKFQFQRSHYQRFKYTSSAQKTKEFRKTLERQHSISRSNSVTSYQSSNVISISFNDITPKNPKNVTKTSQINQESLPPSPPSDDNNKLSPKSAKFIAFQKKLKCTELNDINVSVSSSPSVLEYSNTTNVTMEHTMSSRVLGSRSLTYMSARDRFNENNAKSFTFGSNTDLKIDPDKITIALKEYAMNKGQNLEEIFRPQKTCCVCIVL